MNDPDFDPEPDELARIAAGLERLAAMLPADSEELDALVAAGMVVTYLQSRPRLAAAYEERIAAFAADPPLSDEQRAHLAALGIDPAESPDAAIADPKQTDRNPLPDQGLQRIVDVLERLDTGLPEGSADGEILLRAALGVGLLALHRHLKAAYRALPPNSVPPDRLAEIHRSLREVGIDPDAPVYEAD